MLVGFGEKRCRKNLPLCDLRHLMREDTTHQHSVFLPVDAIGRIRLGLTAAFLLFCVVAGFSGGWPPPGVAPGLGPKIFLAIIFEMCIAIVPLSVLEICWAIAMPDWVRRFHDRAFKHIGLIMFVLVLFGLLGMFAGFMGWW